MKYIKKSGTILESTTGSEVWLVEAEQTIENNSGIEERWIDHEKRVLIAYPLGHNATPCCPDNPNVTPDERSSTERST